MEGVGQASEATTSLREERVTCIWILPNNKNKNNNKNNSKNNSKNNNKNNSKNNNKKVYSCKVE